MRSHGRGILNFGIGALGFVLACLGLNTLLSEPKTDRVVPNLPFFRDHRDDFDTLFIGSSHVHHQIAPAIFDQMTRAAGRPTHALNLGLNGMLPPENFYVVEQILKTKPRNLKWVFVELAEVETKPFPGTEGTPRALYWHDWKRTALVLRAIVGAGAEDGAVALLRRTGAFVVRPAAPETRNLLLSHCVLFAKDFANVGQRGELARWVRRLWKIELPSKDIGPNSDGYISINKEIMETEGIRSGTDSQEAGAPESKFLSAHAAAAYRQLADDVRGSGAVPIFLVTPNVEQTRILFPPESGVAATVMSFNNATEYPALYQKEMRFDPDHLNGPGSEMFTKLLAAKFLQGIHQNEIR